MNNPEKGYVGTCFICGKKLFKNDVDQNGHTSWAFSMSKGPICKSHPGVAELVKKETSFVAQIMDKA